MGIMVVNLGRPRRVVRTATQIPIDLMVTPPSTPYNVPYQNNGAVVAGTIVAGAMVYLTANFKAADLATTGSSNANAANFIGVADESYPQIPGAGITSSSPPPGDVGIAMIALLQDGEFLFHTTSGDTYHPGDLVYLGADGRTVQKTASGTTIGEVAEDQRQVAAANVGAATSVAIAGGTGVDIYVRIKPAKAPF